MDLTLQEVIEHNTKASKELTWRQDPETLPSQLSTLEWIAWRNKIGFKVDVNEKGVLVGFPIKMNQKSFSLLGERFTEEEFEKLKQEQKESG